MKKTKMFALTAMFAALITVMTAYVCHIPVGVNGGYIHFGDALIYCAASVLPLPYALVAAAIGGGLADLLTAPMWTVATVIIKMAIALPFTSKKSGTICTRNIIAVVISGIISAAGYALAEWIMFGNFAAAIAGIWGSAVQSGGSAVLFILIGFALDKCKVKTKILR